MTIDDIPEKYKLKKNGIELVYSGKINTAMEGCACSLASVSKELLEKIKLQDKEFIVVDTEAGVEHFGRGIEKGIDTVIAVSEPYLDSIEVAELVIKLAKEMGKKTHLIINKVPFEFKESVKEVFSKRGIKPAGMLYFYNDVYKSSILGQKPKINRVIADMNEILKNIF